MTAHPIQKENRPDVFSKDVPPTGSHFLCDIQSGNNALLLHHSDLQSRLAHWLEELGLHVVGVVAHDFVPSGFTLVFCLSESHLSIHTFPEKGMVAVDVYLSNYKKDNTEAGRTLMQRLVDFFEADSYCLHEIQR